MLKKILSLCIVLVLSAAAFLGYQYYKSEKALEVKDQPVTESVHIESVTPLRGGFIIIEELSIDTVGYVAIGGSSFVFPEQYTNLDIPIDSMHIPDVLTPGNVLRVRIHDDIGEYSTFESSSVEPVSKDFFNRPIQRFIRIRGDSL